MVSMNGVGLEDSQKRYNNVVTFGRLHRLKQLYSISEQWLYTSGLLSSRGLCLPDFLSIGAPQSGSTWLYANLSKHPQVYFHRKEMRFFEEDFYGSLHYWSLKRHYANHYVCGSQKVKGDISPGYSITPLRRIRFVRKIMPDVRLILILRNPIYRTWSATRHVFSRPTFNVSLDCQRDLKSGQIPEYLQLCFRRHGFLVPQQPTVSTIQEGSEWLITNNGNAPRYTVKKENKRLVFYYSTMANRNLLLEGRFDKLDDSDILSYFQSPHIRKLADYLTILNNWESVFPPGQLYIGFFSDIINRPRKLLTDILSHIGVSQDIDWNSLPYAQVVNKGVSIPIPQKYKDFLEGMYQKEIERLYDRFGVAVKGWRCS